MERSTFAEEENQQKSISITPVVSKPLASLVKIDSISIDLGVPMEKKEARNCQHFSIRGYVAEMRKKDIKICSPFELDGSERKMEKILPPMDVPRFRSWNCHNCLQEIGAASRSVPAVGHTIVTGNEKVLEDDANQKIGSLTFDVSGHAPCLIQEIPTDGTAATKSKDSESIDNHKPNSGIPSILAIEYPEWEQRNKLAVGETSKEVIKVDITPSVVMDSEIRLPSHEVEAFDNEPSKCYDTLTGDNYHIKQNESLSGLPRRRTRKLRLLTELLGENGNAESDQTECTSYNPMPNSPVAIASSVGQRKRKVPQDPLRLMRCPNNEAKKVRDKVDTETTVTASEISDSEQEEEVFASKSYMSIQQKEKRSCSLKMKDKIPQVEDGQAGYMPFKSMFAEKSNGLVPESGMIRNLSENDEISKLVLNLSLNSNVEENKKMVTPKAVIPTNDTWRKGRSCIGEPSSSSNSAPDLLLLSDFNERAARRTTILHQQQNLDFSGQYSNDQAIDPSKIHTNQRSENGFEQKTTDDIPMEIVELMAKHQYERGLSEAERSYCLTRRIDQRNSEMMGYPIAHQNGVLRSLQKEYRTVKRPPFTYSTNGITLTSENVVPNEKIPVNFSADCRNYLIGGQREESPGFSMFGAYSKSQQMKLSSGAQPSASGTDGNSIARSRLWNGDNVVHRSSPTNLKIFDSCKKRQTGSEQSGKVGNFGSSLVSSHIPPEFHTPQKHVGQLSNIKTHAQCPDLNKGKMIRDLDLNLADPNAVDFEIQDKICEYEPFKRTSVAYPFVTKDMGSELNSKGKGSLDSYSNETIPAMQLLSLMDAGMQSRAPFSVDPKKFIEKPFFPCDNHPNFSMGGKSNFLQKPLFPHNHQLKKLSGTAPGKCKGSGSSRHMSSPYDGQGFVISQEPNKEKRAYSHTHNKDRKSRNYVGTSGVSEALHDSNSRQDKRKVIYGASDTVVFPSQWHTLQDPTKCNDLVAWHMQGTNRPIQSISRRELCSVNRNPADFSFPDARNKYMIRGEDLKFGRNIYSRGRTGGVDGRKKQKASKFTASKEHGQSQIP